MLEASTATRPKSPSIGNFDRPSQERLEVSTSTTPEMPAQHESSSIDKRPFPPSTVLFKPSIQENCEFDITNALNITAYYNRDSHPRTAILCENPFDKDPNTLHTSTSTGEDPSTALRAHFDDTSDDFSLGSSGSPFSLKSETSSTANFDKSSESRPIALFNQSVQDKHEVKIRA
ncbi:hypothetical protein PENCOP_c003G03886 [Penicillium coprophilum]|uniref:Uncharacterized protein n=1 Tax=Penicillium coprophilum TaxID=36646 RepID=A0A1V6UZK7_9EURO|nr:hypothetical protein PENCOP_c003G03886 [Penicillium coprophilum]